MTEVSSEISNTFYRIGGIEAPTEVANLDPLWRTFNTLPEAVDNQIGILADNAHGQLDSSRARSLEEAPLLEGENFRGFMERFGYNAESTTTKRLSKDSFAFISQVDSSTVVEIFKSYDFEEDYDALNKRDRISVDSIIASSDKGKAIVLTQPITEQGFGIQYSAQNIVMPHYVGARGVDPGSITSFPLGALANPNSNKYAALSFFHELRHAYQPKLPEYKSELDASEYALQTNTLLKKKGINLTPRVTQEEAKQYLEGYLLGYAKEHHPVKTIVHRTLSNFRQKNN